MEDMELGKYGIKRIKRSRLESGCWCFWCHFQMCRSRKKSSDYFVATLSNGQGVPGSALFYVLYLADFLKGVIKKYRSSSVFGSNDHTLSFADDVIAVCNSEEDILHFDKCFQKRANLQRSIINYDKTNYLIVHTPNEKLIPLVEELESNGNVKKRMSVCKGFGRFLSRRRNLEWSTKVYFVKNETKLVSSDETNSRWQYYFHNPCYWVMEDISEAQSWICGVYLGLFPFLRAGENSIWYVKMYI